MGIERREGKHSPFMAACEVADSEFTLTDGSGSGSFSIQYKDVDGNDIEQPYSCPVWLSDSAAGVGLTGQTISGLSASAGSIAAFTGNKIMQAISSAAGLLTVTVTSSGTPVYVCCQMPDGSVKVSSAALAFS